MAAIKIAIINASTVLTDAAILKVVNALQKQVHNDFYPPWGVDADLTFVPKGKKPSASVWWLAIMDTSDQAGALGYHDLTSKGLPLGKVFAKSDINNGYEWSVTASHELLEMLGDPDINLTAFVQTSATKGTLYSYEVCDACEDDKYGYLIDGVRVSDFIYPAWFESFRKKNSAQFDHKKHLTAPLTLLPGGYIGVFDVSGGGGWTQKTARSTPLNYAMRARVGSRRERRRLVKSEWLRSKV